MQDQKKRKGRKRITGSRRAARRNVKYVVSRIISDRHVLRSGARQPVTTRPEDAIRGAGRGRHDSEKHQSSPGQPYIPSTAHGRPQPSPAPNCVGPPAMMILCKPMLRPSPDLKVQASAAPSVGRNPLWIPSTSAIRPIPNPGDTVAERCDCLMNERPTPTTNSEAAEAAVVWDSPR